MFINYVLMFSQAAKAATDSGIGFGEALLILSLACDGVTGAIQERMKSEHSTRDVTYKWSFNTLLE